MTTSADWMAKGSELAGSEPCRWERLAEPQMAPIRDRVNGLVVLPVGATEQHGPHLPVGTDNAIAAAVCGYASARTGVPLLPVLPFGVSVGHTTKWDGTVSLVHETLALAIRELAQWLVTKGWTRLLLVNSHFGNDATLRVAVDRLRTDFIHILQINTLNTYALSPDIWAYFSSDAADLHANKAETDLMLWIDPDACDMKIDADDPDRTVDTVFSYPVSRTSTNGVTGRPSEASRQRGQSLLIEMGEALTNLLIKAQTERPPLAASP